MYFQEILGMSDQHRGVGRPALALVALMLAIVVPTPSHADGEAPIDFVRDIRPILASKCFTCHGPDVKQRKGKLRLDTADGTSAQPPRADAVVPRKLDDSELYQRIIAHDPEELMPPAKTGKPLTDVEIARLKAWIVQGAEYKTHWAFVPTRRPALPTVADPSWCKTPVDRFILARLDKEGIETLRRGRPRHADSTSQPRPHRPASHARRGRRLRRRCSS